jgi:outer membrane immunogenic protein
MIVRILGLVLAFMTIAVDAKATADRWNWTGFYVGGHAGAGWGRDDWTVCGNASCAPFELATSGPLVGAQIGANYQIGAFVLGVEGEGIFSLVKGDAILSDGGTAFFQTQNHGLATFAARAGVSFDQTFFFVKAGGAWTNDRRGLGIDVLVQISPNPFRPDIFETQTAYTTNSRFGWLVGAGMEWRLVGPWSVKAEYNFMEFDTLTTSLGPYVSFVGPFNLSLDAKRNMQIVKFGFNYHFRPGQ